VLHVMSVSVIPYRSTGRLPVSASIAANADAGNGALPDTRRRDLDNARAASAWEMMRDHTVGTPKYIVPGDDAYASGVGRTV
jgi:hypothetical protein